MKWLLGFLTVSALLFALVLMLFVACEETTKIAYQANADDIYVMDSDGSNQTWVTTDEHLGRVLCWSNDNKRLAYISETFDSKYNLVIVDIDGGEKTVIDLDIIPEVSQDKSEAVLITSRCWNPTSERILVTAYQGFRDHKIYEIFVKDGKDAKNNVPFEAYNNSPSLRAVAKLVNSDGLLPYWSPSGDSYVFTRNWATQIIDVRDDKILTKGLTEHLCYDWSPNEKKLLCLGLDMEDRSIYIISRDGGQKTKIGIAPLDENEALESISWSPDGYWILFSVMTYSGPSAFRECFMYTAHIDDTEQSDMDVELSGGGTGPVVLTNTIVASPLKILDRDDACYGIYSNP